MQAHQQHHLLSNEEQAVDDGRRYQCERDVKLRWPKLPNANGSTDARARDPLDIVMEWVYRSELVQVVPHQSSWSGIAPGALW